MQSLLAFSDHDKSLWRYLSNTYDFVKKVLWEIAPNSVDILKVSFHTDTYKDRFHIHFYIETQDAGYWVTSPPGMDVEGDLLFEMAEAGALWFLMIYRPQGGR